MNFFESQDAAKRNTGKLVLLFALAVLALIGITNVLVMLVFQYAATGGTSMAMATSPRFDWQQFLYISLGVSAVILFGSLYRIASLRGGGARVAEMMDGRLLLNSTEDADERRVLNVVEEMALASGTPVPPVYLMEEEGINAFAAGYAPGDAVIGITRGAIQTLDRDQLQGVIAHEFSHILHGDMRINIRLIGVLYGILVLGLIGHMLMRSGAGYRHGMHISSSRSKNSGGIVMLGLGLVVVGFVGTFFGNLIKAAVSRQREYLADASAVQFTRNPDGIGEALMKIATHGKRSHLDHPESNEISHALFEEAGQSSLAGLYATHPPLEERIQAVLPGWDGSFDRVLNESPRGASVDDQDAAVDTEGQDRRRAVLGAIVAGGVLAGGAAADGVGGAVGNPQQQGIDDANRLLGQIQPQLLDAAHEPAGARALLYLLLLSNDAAMAARQQEHIEKSADLGVADELRALQKTARPVEDDQRLPLINIAVGSLRQLSEPQYRRFRDNLDRLIKLDEKVNLFEWSLQKIVTHHLDPVFGLGDSHRLGRDELRSKGEEISMLLSAIAYSNRQSLGAREVFSRGSEALAESASGKLRGIELLTKDSLSLDRLNGALDSLNKLKPLQKPALLKACAAAILADGQVVAIEAELLRAVAATLDCPMPPLQLNSAATQE